MSEAMTIRARSAAMRGARAAALFGAVWLVAGPAAAQQPNPSDGPCAVTGSPNVFIEGAAMLRLGDVQGCPDLNWEIIPGVFINGQPAVRLLPKEDCSAGGGADSVIIDGSAATRQGDSGC